MAAERAELQPALAEELNRLMRRGYKRTFGLSRTRGEPLDLPVFFEVVRRLRNVSRVSVDDIEAVLGDAIQDGLSDHIGDGGLTYRRIGKIMFLADRQALKGGQGGTELSAILRQIRYEGYKLDADRAPQRQVIKNVRLLLAEHLISQAYPELLEEVAYDVVDQGAPSLVDRPLLDAQLRRAIKSAQQPVVIWGESGTGKSTLATRVLRETQDTGRASVTLRGGSEESSDFDVDLIGFLSDHKIRDGRVRSFAGRLSALRQIIQSPDLKDLLLFDNLHPDMGAKVLGGDIKVRATVVVTQRGEPAPGSGLAIHVGGFETAEALAAGRLILPSANEELISDLAKVLGGRPIAIDIACRLISVGALTFGAVLRMLDVNPRDTLRDGSDVVGEHYTEPIAAVYAKASQLLREPAQANALQVLDALLWIARRSREDLALTCVAMGVLPSELSVHAGLARLRNLGLIHIDEGGAIELNDLTVALLRQEYVDRLDATLRRYFQLGEKVMPALPKPFGPLPGNIYAQFADRAKTDPIFNRRLQQYFQLQRARWVYNFFAARADAGTLYLGNSEFLMWQRGVEWFTAGSILPKFALGTPSKVLPEYLIWEPERQPYVADKYLDEQVRGYKFAQWAGLRTFRAIQGRGLDPGMPEAEYIELFPQPADGVEHRWVSNIPADVAARHNMPIWSDCGRLITPPRDEPTKTCAVCDTRKPGSDLEVLPTLAWMTTILDRDTCDLRIALPLVNGFLARRVDPKWDADCIDLLGALIERVDEKTEGITSTQAWIYGLWYQVVSLEYEAKWGFDDGYMGYPEDFDSRGQLARLRKMAAKRLDPITVVYLSRRMADAYRAMGESESEILALRDALTAARKLSPFNMDAFYVASRLKELGEPAEPMLIVRPQLSSDATTDQPTE